MTSENAWLGYFSFCITYLLTAINFVTSMSNASVCHKLHYIAV